MTVDLVGFIILALAAYRLTRFVVEDAIFADIREKIWKKWPPSTKFGYLFTCYWCTGFWVSLKLTILAFFFPDFTFVVSLVLAISALIGLISAWAERQ